MGGKEKNMRLIDADEAYKVLTDYYHQRTEIQHEALKEALSKVPTADAVPVRHGQWIGKPIAGYSTVRCTQCGDVFLENSGQWNYCPSCGAKMDEVKDVKY